MDINTFFTTLGLTPKVIAILWAIHWVLSNAVSYLPRPLDGQRWYGFAFNVAQVFFGNAARSTTAFGSNK
jgi:hypothetical protein